MALHENIAAQLCLHGIWLLVLGFLNSLNFSNEYARENSLISLFHGCFVLIARITEFSLSWLWLYGGQTMMRGAFSSSILTKLGTNDFFRKFRKKFLHEIYRDKSKHRNLKKFKL